LHISNYIDVEQVQKTFRQVLTNYDRLVTSAAESDRVLFEKSQRMESDPKFRLLKYRKAELDELVARSGGANSHSRRRSNPADDATIDVTALATHLENLS